MVGTQQYSVIKSMHHEPAVENNLVLFRETIKLSSAQALPKLGKRRPTVAEQEIGALNRNVWQSWVGGYVGNHTRLFGACKYVENR